MFIWSNYSEINVQSPQKGNETMSEKENNPIDEKFDNYAKNFEHFMHASKEMKRNRKTDKIMKDMLSSHL